jgi:pyruvate dehydrogenase E1 component alpha subunit
MGGYGIVGGNLPLAAGLALASQYRGEDSVTVCMFGDGASNTGNFGETMNLAALWKLPIVFMVENNLYGMGTAVERHSAQTDLSKKAEGFGIPGERIDGMDVLAVREGVSEHIGIAREEGRPTLVEAFTYRFRGHSAADPEVYRTKEEVEEWRQKDPIETFAARAVSEDALKESDVEEIRARADKIVTEAVEFADGSPEPPLESLYENLYVVTETMGWYAVDERSPEPHRGELEHEAGDEAKQLAEAGAAHAGRPAGPRPNPAREGDATEGTHQAAREDEAAEEDQG